MGLLTKEIEIKITSNTAKYYENKGYILPKKKATKSTYKKYKKEYVYDYSVPIKIKIEDLSIYSKKLVDVQCDFCGKIQQINYCDYCRSYNHSNIYACRDCIHKKAEMTMMRKYGVKSPIHVPEFRKKQYNTMMERWHVLYPLQNSEIKERVKITNINTYGYVCPLENLEIKKKAEQTTLQNWGVKNPFESPIIQNNIKTTIKEKYNVDNIMDSPIIKEHFAQSIYQNQTCATSNQQKYLYQIYGGELNGVIKHYNCDIVLRDEKIYIEYQGGGHNLCVKIGYRTFEEFQQREVIRNNIIKREGYKRIEITSRKDKLPSDEILLDILDQSKQYFEQTSHTWREWDIDNGVFRDAEHKDGEPYDYGPLRSIKKKDVEIAS